MVGWVEFDGWIGWRAVAESKGGLGGPILNQNGVDNMGASHKEL